MNEYDNKCQEHDKVVEYAKSIGDNTLQSASNCNWLEREI